MTDALFCHIHLPVCLWIKDPNSRAVKKNASHGNEVLLQDIHISYKDHVTSEKVCAKIQWAIRPHEDLSIIKRCKLKWYEHVSRSSCLDKTILQGTVKGERRQDRQKKRWEDDVREWTGLEFAKYQRVVENREKNGRNWLWSHLWCPNNPHSSGIDEGEGYTVTTRMILH